jgi:hypothetical protein
MRRVCDARFVPSAEVLATFILRLIPSALLEGGFVGRVECVETGEGATCRHLDELLSFLRAQLDPATISEGNR